MPNATSQRAPNLSDYCGTLVGDDFTSEPTITWKPPCEYEKVTINRLAPGPRRVTFTCKVVNIFKHSVQSKSPHAANGCIKLLVKDDSGKIQESCFFPLVITLP